MWLVENICPSHDPFKYIIFQGSLGASYKTFDILNSGNFDFVNFLSILKKFLHAKEKIKALYGVFDDDNHHCSCIW
jgi:Ca2+-binding EF-hand superfamily protein